jgi:hypothetical protein
MSWHPWFNVSGGRAALGSPITAVARNPNHLDLFVTGTDGGIYSTWWDAAGGWANWFNVSGGKAALGSRIEVVARNPNHLDLFATGTDGGIYSTWWDASGGWANWFNVSGGKAALGSPITAVARNPNHLDLFATGTDGGIYSTWWDAVPDSIRLNFNMETQTQSNWCWAATSKSVAAYYDPATTWTQCAIANGEKGQTTCCTNGSSSACNAYGTLDTSLQRVGHLDHMVGGTATYDEVMGQMRAGRPLGARTAWSGGGAHFVAIIGALAGDLYAIDDPIYHKSDVSEDTFKTAYQGTGSWTHSYYTK